MKKARPCRRHNLAFGNKEDPTLVGIINNGCRVRKCLVCGWWIKKPLATRVKRYSVRDLIKNWRKYGRQNQ